MAMQKKSSRIQTSVLEALSDGNNELTVPNATLLHAMALCAFSKRLLRKLKGSYVSKALLGEVLLSGRENFSCRSLKPYIGRSSIS